MKLDQMRAEYLELIWTLIFVFLIMSGIMVVLGKYGLIDKFSLWASGEKVPRIIYKMSGCEFCIEHHLGVIVLVLNDVLTGFHWYDLFIPLMSAGLSSVLKRR